MGGDYYWYKNHGICTDCHENDAYKGHTRCLDCRLKVLDRAAERRCSMTEQDLAERRKKKSIYNTARFTHRPAALEICDRVIDFTKIAE